MAFKDSLLTLTSYPDTRRRSPKMRSRCRNLRRSPGGGGLRGACGSARALSFRHDGQHSRDHRKRNGEEPEQRQGHAGGIRRRCREIRHSARNPTRKMPKLRGPGSAGRPRAASRPHHRAGAGRLRPVVRRSRDIRIGAAYPRSAREPAGAPVRTGDGRRRLGFQPCRGARVSDAMPLLEKARKVRIVTVTNEKKLDSKHSAEALARTSLATASTWCSTRSMPTDGGSARCSKPIPFRTRSTFS